MNAVVVDTNVPLVADGFHDDVSAACVRSCNVAVAEAIKSTVCIDSGLRILDEYFKNLGWRGQPGLGRQFVKWVHERQAMPVHVELVEIHQVNADNEPEQYAEFPDDPELAKFDPSDRKFVAVALASQFAPKVLNACDSGWWKHREPLQRHGLSLVFVCPERYQ